MKKLNKIALIALLVFSNISIVPAFAKESSETSTKEKVSLYLLESNEDLVLYKDKELEVELTSIKNNSSALLLEENDTENSSLVEVETIENEELKGYINSEAVVEDAKLLEEHKLYAEEENEDIPIYIDDTLEDTLYEIKDNTSVLVNETDLETSKEEELDHVYVTLNPEVEEIPKELEETFEKVEEIYGFVHIDHLVALEDEAEYLLERKIEKEDLEEDIATDPEESVEDETKEEPSEDIEETEDIALEGSEIVAEEELKEGQAVEESKETKEELTDESKNPVKEEIEDEEDVTQERNTFSMMQSTPNETSTSRLGHIRGGNRLIYKTIGGKSFTAMTKYQNKVYYIKKEARQGSQTYYLLSNSPSATSGVLGWMKSKDVSTHTHKGVTKTPKPLSIKGTGKGTTKAWGGSKDTIHASMNKHKGKMLHVNLTEKVGENTWYRGKINDQGKNVWLHSSQTEKTQIKEKSTSLLGHVKGGGRTIYKKIGGKSFKANANYQNKVYYIKREAKVGSETYYLLSISPNAIRGTVGWMKAKDVSTHIHTGVTKTPKPLSIKGTGKGTTKAWGGSKDTIHASMNKHKGKMLHVNLTEKVGKNTWYRGKINDQGKNVWLHSSQTEKMQIKEKNTSLLGHVKGGGRTIYKEIGGKLFKANANYQNKVYYIKREAKAGSETYYLLSTSPSTTQGVVGWVKSKDLSTHTHKSVTKKSKQIAIKGTGKGTSKAWGGSKDTIHSSMSRFKDQTFNVNLTEKVGKNTWYRGKVRGEGKNVWLHSSQTQKIKAKESSTSRLGHIRGGERFIYKTLDGERFKASAKHRDTVYYIKRQAKLDSETYYLISTSPSATRGVVGWVKSKDLSTHTHKGVTKKTKQVTIKGTDKGTSKAWGGSKDTIHSSMSRFKGKKLHVNLTEKVGENTWYRGKINGKDANVWLHSSQTKGSKPLIVLDAGHGGSDPGASSNGLVEKKVTLDITLRAEKILKARGYNVILTRKTDKFVGLSKRSNIANQKKASSFLSIHANSGGGIGTETWWQNSNNAVTSKRFAQTIQNAVIKKTNARDRGIKHGNLSVNRQSKMTSALLEVGFLDSLTDARNLKKASYKNKIANGIADGFDKYYK